MRLDSAQTLQLTMKPVWGMQYKRSKAAKQLLHGKYITFLAGDMLQACRLQISGKEIKKLIDLEPRLIFKIDEFREIKRYLYCRPAHLYSSDYHNYPHYICLIL